MTQTLTRQSCESSTLHLSKPYLTKLNNCIEEYVTSGVGQWSVWTKESRRLDAICETKEVLIQLAWKARRLTGLVS